MMQKLDLTNAQWDVWSRQTDPLSDPTTARTISALSGLAPPVLRDLFADADAIAAVKRERRVTDRISRERFFRQREVLNYNTARLAADGAAKPKRWS